jgi:hypothetical protein
MIYKIIMGDIMLAVVRGENLVQLTTTTPIQGRHALKKKYRLLWPLRSSKIVFDHSSLTGSSHTLTAIFRP